MTDKVSLADALKVNVTRPRHADLCKCGNVIPSYRSFTCGPDCLGFKVLDDDTR